MRLLILLAVLLAHSAEAQPVITEDAKLVGSGTSMYANPGWSIAAAEGFVVLGARLDDSVYVFRKTVDGWEEEVSLSASQESYYTFGFAVGAWSRSGEEVALVGAHGRSDLPANDVAYVFRSEPGGTWVEEARLSNGPEDHEFFGRAVAIHSDYAVVGAPGADDAGGTTGAAYVFRRTTDGTWVEDARLVASDASMKAGFGRGADITVSREGVPFVVIGAPSDSDQRGAAYAFRRTTDGTWVEEAKLVEPDFDTGGLFGRDVAITETPDGEILALAGELGDQNNGLQTGAGYVYRREGDGIWGFEEKLTAADGQSGQRLGWSVALAAAPEVGGTVAVLGGDGAYNFAGTVRLFRRTAGENGPLWTEEAELWASDRAPGDQIGYSVGASGRYAVAGAPNNDGRGAGYVWDLRQAVPVEPTPVSSTERGTFTVYPNPSAGVATVALALGEAAHVRVAMFDVLGREVEVLHDRRLAAGTHAFAVEAARWPAGAYVVRATGGVEAVQRFTVVH